MMRPYSVLFLLTALALTLVACNLGDAIGATEDPLAGPTPLPPGDPVYMQEIFDCPTWDHAADPPPIQPWVGCDRWLINRYERPFNQTTQDEYYPDLDIQLVKLGLSGDYLFAHIELYDPRPEDGLLHGTYSIEIDFDLDGRGDLLVSASQPELQEVAQWTRQGVQVWADSNEDVGDLKPLAPDYPNEGDGYDELLFDEGLGDDPALAWVRAFEGNSAIVELAFKPSLLEGATTFKWWAWADEGVDDPAAYDYHDTFNIDQAGQPFQGLKDFPIDEIYAVDNTCAELWNTPPDPNDETLCVNDPNVPKEPPGGGGTPTPTPPGDVTPTPTTPGDVTPTPTDEDCPPETAGVPTCTPTPTVEFTPTDTPTLPSLITPTDTPRTPPIPSPSATEECPATVGAAFCTPTPSPIPPSLTPSPTRCMDVTGAPCTPTPRS